MPDWRSIGIAEKISSKPGRRTCTAAVLSRHNFLLSQFQAYPIPDSAAVQWKFAGQLPRASNLHQAVNIAMADAGLKVAKGTIEISAEQEHQMNSLLSLFVQAQPEIVESGDSGKGKLKRKTYAYYCNQVFMVEPGRTAAQALATTYPFKGQRIIVGLLREREEIFHLMHTALRKAACSPVSAAAHSAFQLAGPVGRAWIIDTVDIVFNSTEFVTAEDVVDAIRAELTDGANESWRKSLDGILLHNLFRAFSDQDWFDMLCYFFIWPGAVAKQKAA